MSLAIKFELISRRFTRVLKITWVKLVAFCFLFLLWWFCLPSPLFQEPHSTVIESQSGKLLGAHIAPDGQWRFPEVDSVPQKYEACLLAFEDQYFRYHLGINPFSIGRALVQNISHQRVVSGGSTISMQLIRLSRKGKERNVGQKLIEMVQALRLECRYTKDEILKLYASHAPFGGNVVGLDAAAWRYFGRSASQLSWAESALLAVLPNAPSLIYPGKRNSELLAKRNRLLHRLHQRGIISESTFHLAQLEDIPQQTYAIPQLAPHLLSRVLAEHGGKRIRTTIDYNLQQQSNDAVRRHLKELRANQVHNAAALILDVRRGEVLAYVGNSPDLLQGEHGEQVDVIRAPRSSGSILKPFLYALCQDAGQILPETLLPDIPMQIGGFSPQNFNLKYSGAVPASLALSRSLNIPSVKMLQAYGVERFYDALHKLQFSTINQDYNHYGLALILGGAEVNLWDVSGAYAAMARSLLAYEQNNGQVYTNNFQSPSYQVEASSPVESRQLPISLGASWLTFQALLQVNRPNEESNWEVFSSSQKVAWKTGTSFGFRDAWAVGLNADYVVAVWCGNADGEGRPGLTGTTAAAPLLFQLFKLLPRSSWFACPHDELVEVAVCHQSGYRVGMHCPDADTILIVPKGLETTACPYHHLLHLDSSERWQVSSACYPMEQMMHRPWFELPPVMAWYYQKNHPFYQARPAFMPGCASPNESKTMALIYPRENNRIFLPTQLDGTAGEVVLEATHNKPDATIYWHVDQEFVAQTQAPHKLPIAPSKGKHLLTLIDNKGHVLYRNIEVVGKRKAASAR